MCSQAQGFEKARPPTISLDVSQNLGQAISDNESVSDGKERWERRQRYGHGGREGMNNDSADECQRAKEIRFV